MYCDARAGVQARTRIEREFEPSAVAAMKREAARDLSIGGPGLAAEALRAGLVDECHLLLTPVAVGGGTAALPPGLRVDLELRGERRRQRRGRTALLRNFGALPRSTRRGRGWGSSPP